MLKWFMSLTDEQLERFIDVRYNVANLTKVNVLASDKGYFKYVFGSGFSLLMAWYEDCNHDRTLLRLRYADEIEKLAYIFYNEPDGHGPYPQELERYMRHA
jgi:hypothetical protein